MATKKATPNAVHTAGIYADMTVDGPEIGTLVVVVDRAKNLPNRRTMGKQDPYCAARLGKEAKKTTTDKRGGQTPRWDQELRFTVHDSPDYHNLKVSIFNDDKKTELIGESWVSLDEVVVPGGGQSDIWHSLNYRGKYAGEVRMELTYYDSRPKPEKPASERHESGSNTPVKRRPLPSNPGSARTTPLGFGSEPRPLPSASGPRDFGTPSRRQMEAHSRSAGNTPSNPGRTAYNNDMPQPLDYRRPLPQPGGSQETYPEEQYPQYDDLSVSDRPASSCDPYYDAPRSEYGYPQSTAGSDLSYALPELPPMASSRRSRFARGSQESPPPQRQYEASYNQHDPPILEHSYSAPTIPVPDVSRYDEQVMPPLDHTQSDSVLEHGQPRHRSHPPYIEANLAERYDEYPGDYAPVLYNEHQDEQLPPMDRLRQQSDPFDLSSRSNHRHSEFRHQSLPPDFPTAEAAPPPPAHKSQSSTPSYTPYRKPLPPQDITPAPLNISGARHSRVPSMQPSSPVEYRSEQEAPPYDDSPFRASRDNAYYGRSPTYPLDQAGRPTSRSDASSYGAPPSQYSYGPQNRGSHEALSHVHRKSVSQAGDTYNTSPYASGGAPASTAPLRDHRMSVPYTQQSSPLGSERGCPYGPDHPSPLSIKTPPHRQTPPRPHTMYTTPPSAPFQPSPTQSYNTPPRRHPLSQQQNAANVSPNYNHQYSSPPVTAESPPLIKPRALSPVPDDPRQPRPSNRSTPTTRKSVSPRPLESAERRGPGIPFGPDSYDQFNPSASVRSTASSLANNPATSAPHTPLGSAHQSPYAEPEGPIVDFHGNKIDPSDRLPESSWAPEPEKKIPVKVKPLREREKLNGARPRGSPDAVSPLVEATSRQSPTYPSSTSLSTHRAHHAATTSQFSSRLLPVADTTPPPASAAAATLGRNKLRKMNAPASNRPHSMAAVSQPFANIPSPASDHTYGLSSSAGASPYAPSTSTATGGRHSMYGNYGGSKSSYNLGASPAAPPIPAKVPLDDMAVLSEEMRRIDIGPSAGSAVGGSAGRVRKRGFGFGR